MAAVIWFVFDTIRYDSLCVMIITVIRILPLIVIIVIIVMMKYYSFLDYGELL